MGLIDELQALRDLADEAKQIIEYPDGASQNQIDNWLEEYERIRALKPRG